MHPEPIQKLISLFCKLPTVGPRTASRFAYYLANSSVQEAKELADAILELKKTVSHCRFCFCNFKGSEEAVLCPICKNLERKKILCVVEKEIDMEAIEKTGKFKGIYFVLGGLLAKFSQENETSGRLPDLIERIQSPQKFGLREGGFSEIILALNPTPEGEITSRHLERKLAPLSAKITHLAKGMPVGGELEYADEETLENALEGRK